MLALIIIIIIIIIIHHLRNVSLCSLCICERQPKKDGIRGAGNYTLESWYYKKKKRKEGTFLITAICYIISLFSLVLSCHLWENAIMSV